MNTTLSIFRSQLPSALPWMAGASIAFVVRLAASLGGMDGYNADALAMYLFLASSLMILAWSQSVPHLQRECSGTEWVRSRFLPWATLSLASAMSGIFAFLLVRDF